MLWAVLTAPAHVLCPRAVRQGHERVAPQRRAGGNHREGAFPSCATVQSVTDACCSLPQANLKTYRFIDNVWTFVLDDATFTLSLGKQTKTIHVQDAKIVAAAAPATR